MTTERPSPHHNGTDPARPRRRRASKGRLRATAWVAAGVSVAAPLAALEIAPRPVDATVQTPRRVVIVHRTIRRVVIDPPAAPAAAPAGAPQVHIVYVGGGTVTAGGSSGGGSAGTTRCSGC